MPARDTVAGVAVLKCEISNKSLIEGVRGILSLLANVRIYEYKKIINNLKYTLYKQLLEVIYRFLKEHLFDVQLKQP